MSDTITRPAPASPAAIPALQRWCAVAWVRDAYAAIHPRSGSAGSSIDVMSGDDDQRAADNHERLPAVNAVQDPRTTPFSVNQNIAPVNGS